jgi:tetratricopeptide (TPR) repeat protein
VATPAGAAAPAAGITPDPADVEGVEPTGVGERPSDFPAALGSLDELDLPVISAALPAVKGASVPAPFPGASPARPVSTPAARAPSGAEAADDVDSLDFDLPAVSGGGSNPPGPTGLELDLPATRDASPRVPSLDMGGQGRSASPVSTGPHSMPDLPVVRPGGGRADLPAVVTNLPVAAGAGGADSVDLPAPTGGPARPGAPPPPRTAPLPPKVTAPLPKRTVPLGGSGAPPLPGAAAAGPLPLSMPQPPVAPPISRAFGEVRLPSAPPGPISQPDVGGGAIDTLSGFGEIDLPREQPTGSHSTVGETEIIRPGSIPAPRGGSGTVQLDPAADFGDLKFDDDPPAAAAGGGDFGAGFGAGTGAAPEPSSDGGPGAASPPAGSGDAGLTFGEVDFGSGAPSGPQGADQVKLDGFQWTPPSEDRGAGAEAPMGEGVEAPGIAPEEVAAPGGEAAPGSDAPPRASKLALALKIAAGLLVLVVIIGGASLELTPYGAWGRVYLYDLSKAADYKAASAGAVREGERVMRADTYDAAREALEATAQSHARMPRARPLTAYNALIDAETQLRFGVDPGRASRAKQLFAELPVDKPVQYFDAAAAAIAAMDGDVAKAQKLLDSASKQDRSDGIQIEIALVRANVALASKDLSTAIASYKRVLDLSGQNDARAHYGLARAYDLAGDAASTKKEIDATLAASKDHPGALVLRARRKTAHVDPAQAFADLAVVLEGAARAKVAPSELSDAYSAKAWVSLERGAASDAREAFAQAVKINPRNAEALSGEGRLLLNEGRPAEALARFDSALQLDPNSPEAVANDAEAKVGLERLADAKQQLLSARDKFPRSIPVLILLGKVEAALGNQDEAEKDMRAAIAHVEPGARDAPTPYTALAELLLKRGRQNEATALLDEARKKLPESVMLERGLGEVAEMQGNYDGAVADYKAALAVDPKDVGSHFHLGMALIRTLKFSEASEELDQVAAIDKDYPNLALERGILFEKSGDLNKAIEQFEGALNKAPGDLDLMLRVGSAYVTIGVPDKAAAMLSKVVDKRPNSAEAHHFYGRALMLKGGSSWGDALIHLTRAAELDPNKVEYHIYLAWAANDSVPARIKTAQEEIERAFALDRSNADAYWQRGVLRRMTNQIDDAIKDELHTLQLRPGRYEAHATLAECFSVKNEMGRALDEWQQAFAGDGKRVNADGTVKHPFWHYQYGKLLLERGAPGEALPHLKGAALTAEKMDSPPGWGAQVEFMVAELLRAQGDTKGAIEHYHRYGEQAMPRDPDYRAYQRALHEIEPQE